MKAIKTKKGMLTFEKGYNDSFHVFLNGRYLFTLTDNRQNGGVGYKVRDPFKEEYDDPVPIANSKKELREKLKEIVEKS